MFSKLLFAFQQCKCVKRVCLCSVSSCPCTTYLSLPVYKICKDAAFGSDYGKFKLFNAPQTCLLPSNRPLFMSWHDFWNFVPMRGYVISPARTCWIDFLRLFILFFLLFSLVHKNSFYFFAVGELSVAKLGNGASRGRIILVSTQLFFAIEERTRCDKI